MDSGRQILLTRLKEVACPAFIRRDLSRNQLEALHAFRAELEQSIDRLYKTIPAKQADPVLCRIMTRLINQMKKDAAG